MFNKFEIFQNPKFIILNNYDFWNPNIFEIWTFVQKIELENFYILKFKQTQNQNNILEMNKIPKYEQNFYKLTLFWKQSTKF
jgi:hypothetical protein